MATYTDKTTDFSRVKKKNLHVTFITMKPQNTTDNVRSESSQRIKYSN